jgi:TRAP-type mannitol/chloroaromatic compound transport system permease small subunit
MLEQFGATFNQGLDWIMSILNTAGTIWVFALTALINADVFGRNILLSPVTGVIEMIELSLIGIVFLQLGDATRKGRMTRSDGFLNLISRKSPAWGHRLSGLWDVMGALFFGIILFGTWPILVQSWVENLYKGDEGRFTAPTWPIKLIVIIGCVILILHFIRMAVHHFRAQQAEDPS